MNGCIRLINSLQYFSYIRPVKEVKRASIGIISILGNLRSVYTMVFVKFFFEIFCLIISEN